MIIIFKLFMYKRFAFGKNWKNYLEQSFTPVAYQKAEESMCTFLDGNSLKGRTFLDVGCGSGIHSLVAHRLGATRIVSIDYDNDSVACTVSLAKKEEGDWTVIQGSMLDSKFMKSLGTFDVVYCWGVAHHTGDMWKALENLILNVKEGGLLYIAIYNTLEGRFGSKTWYRIKKIYTHSPQVFKKIMEYIYFGIHFFRILIHFKNPFSVMSRYYEKRGMSYRHDLVDWLGGYPYEHAHAEEIFNYYHKKHNMELIKLKTTNFIGNNQFLFKKK